MRITIEQLLRILSLQYKNDENADSPPLSSLYIESSSKKPTEKGKSLVLEGESPTVVVDLLDDKNIRGVEIT